MRKKTNKRIKSLLLRPAILFCGFILVGSQVKVFGVEQGSSYVEAKPILVDIQNNVTDFNMNLLQNHVLVLEASDKTRYQSSPVLIDSDHGYCEFSDSISPGTYMLMMSPFGVERKILKWKFQPMIVNGDPKPFIITVELDFHY